MRDTPISICANLLDKHRHCQLNDTDYTTTIKDDMETQFNVRTYACRTSKKFLKKGLMQLNGG